MKRFGFHSNSRGADEIKDLSISIDFQAQKHGVVTPVYYYISMVILKTFNEICDGVVLVLAFLSVQSKTNILYVNISFTGNLVLGFGRYCCKVLPDPAVFHLF